MSSSTLREICGTCSTDMRASYNTTIMLSNIRSSAPLRQIRSGSAEQRCNIDLNYNPTKGRSRCQPKASPHLNKVHEHLRRQKFATLLDRR